MTVQRQIQATLLTAWEVFLCTSETKEPFLLIPHKVYTKLGLNCTIYVYIYIKLVTSPITFCCR